MNKIEDVVLEPCATSGYVKPYRVSFKQNGKSRQWDYIIMHDSVSILLFNTQRQEFILVRQFRPVVFMYLHGKKVPSKVESNNAQPWQNVPAELANQAITYELCSGIVDKNCTLVKIAQEEILEECGYAVPVEKIHRVTSTRRVGTAGTLQTLYYAECTDDMIVSSGGGNEYEGEMIDVVYLPLNKAKDFIFDESYVKPAGLIMAFLWFFQYSPHLNNQVIAPAQTQSINNYNGS